jgi:peptide/nickel transport system permease protein
VSNPTFVNEFVEEAAVSSQPARKRRLGVLFWISVGWIGLNVFGAIFANVLPLINPLTQNYNVINAGPSLHHLLGTDDLGRDIFSRIVFGSRVSIEVSLGAMLIAFGIGAPLGMLAAYRRGKFDALVSTVMYVFLAFPAIIATIAVLSFWTPRSLLKIIVVIGIAAIPLVYRVIRSATLCKGPPTDAS